MRKERKLQKISHDDWYFENKYKDYGIKSRYDFYIWKTNKEYGETFNLINYVDKNHISKQKGTGSTDIFTENNGPSKQKVKIIPPRFDIEDIFKFDYNEMFNYKQNKKFNKLYSLAFNHSFSNDDKNKKYQRFIEIYDEDLMNGNIEIINNICQRLSQYIIDNDINMSRYVGGSVICNIALMISNYIKTGELDTSIDFICKMSEKDMNEEYNTYCLFLLCQIFTSKYHHVNQYIFGNKTKEWWRISLIRHRYSDKDMKTKGVVPIFTMTNGEINYKFYQYGIKTRILQ